MKRFALLLILLPSLAYAQDIAGRASVVDGDTLEIHGKRIRLHGIDAPESRQSCRMDDGTIWRCGQQAALSLSDHIGQRTVSCQGKDVDRYKRIVAVCRSGGEDLNAWMVTEGMALAYRRYSTDYVKQEERANLKRRGVWSGEFVAPWDWRRGKRLPEKQATRQQRCKIKGNVSRSGKRIYHLPGGHYYDRTRIEETKGERWFCTEAEARAAGWRRSKR